MQADLRSKIRRLERGGRAAELSPVPSGCPALDAVLPRQGLARGGLHVVQGRPGDGAVYGFTLALTGRLRANDGIVVWIQCGRDCQENGIPYGPGLRALGIDSRHLLLVKARRAVDLLWSMEEALRCPDLAVIVGEGVAPNITAARRLQLAAETGSTTAVLVTPPGTAPNTTALTHWRIAAAPAETTALPPRHPAWTVELVRCRGGKPGQWRMEWRHETFHLDLAAPLVDRPVVATV